MPLYEYQCDACAHRFEVIQKFSDAPIDVCPKCGGAVQKLLSSPAIQFKGSGFYLTDYGRGTGNKSEGGAKGNKADTGAKAGSEGGGDGKSETAKSAAATSDSASPSTKAPADSSSAKTAPAKSD